MRFSKYYLPTQKNNPSDAEAISHKLLLRAGYIQQNEKGLYTILPIGLRVLKKIQKIIEKELDLIDAMQISMPIVQSKQLWNKSGRGDYCGDETLQIFDRHKKEYLFSPTNEEMINDILSSRIKSYKQLPLCTYQINWKFRDEIRPRFGLLRAREFLMMDAYSFHLNQECATETYWKYYNAYIRIFKKMGINAIPMKADSGPIGGDLSHEFHIIADTGESTIYLDSEILNSNSIHDKTKLFAVTEDKFNKEDFEKNHRQNLKGELIIKKGIEVGHIFYVGQEKYSKTMEFKVQNATGQQIYPEMCTYGIGLTRVMAAIVEACHDEKGIKWPEEVAPFDAMLINLDPNDEKCSNYLEETYRLSQKRGEIDILYDDTNDSVGEKLARADLIGIPFQQIYGSKLHSSNQFRYKARLKNIDEILKIN
jgi:prolyl-tRNA synthetase